MSTSQKSTLSGVVTHVIHQVPGHTIALLSPDEPQEDDKPVKFLGKLFACIGDRLQLEGSWSDHEDYGRQFKVSRVVAAGAPTVEGIAAALAGSRDAKGVGPKKAQRIAEDYLERLKNPDHWDPESVADRYQIPQETAEWVVECLEKRQGFLTATSQLGQFGLSLNQISVIWAKYGGSSLSVVRNNPYELVETIDGIGFGTADEIAANVGIPRDHPTRITAAVKHAVQDFEADTGSTLFLPDEINKKAREILKVGSDWTGRIDAAIGTMTSKRELIAVYGSERGYLALPATHRSEGCIAEFLRDRQPSPNDRPLVTVEDVREGSPHLDDSQVSAVVLALTHPASVICGGAGSGKTTTIKAIVDSLLKYRISVALCAPTGKAAQRLREVMPGVKAETIHRLLEWSNQHAKFTRNGENPLKQSVIVVDEVSMVDSKLARHLFAAIQKTTRVIFVGDNNQLPPVGPGNMLRDMIVSRLLPVVKLSECHRAAGDLKRNAHAILSGEVGDTVKWDRQEKGCAGPWYACRLFGNETKLLNQLAAWFDQIEEKFGYDPIDDVQILSPIKGGIIGTRSINLAMQRVRQRKLGVTVTRADAEEFPDFYVGDKVIQTRNDYELDVMNGNQGVILGVDPLVIQFDDRVVNYTGGTGNLDLAYALTVHKAQGSEYKCVIVVCHSSHKERNHQSLLYTAITRAQKTCMIIGDTSVNEVARKPAPERLTLLPLLFHED